MMDFSSLRKLSKETYPEHAPSISRMLSAWAVSDRDKAFARFLKSHQISKEQFMNSFAPFINETSTEEKSLLEACLHQITLRPLNGYDLLKALCKNPDHPISQHMSTTGINLHTLQAGIEQRRPGLDSVYSALGLELDTESNILLKYGRDLTAEAREGAFDDLCDRPEEIERLTEVLLRKQKGNAALTGPAGVGKTALVELFSRQIITGDVAEDFTETTLFELSMSKIVAGTQYRGQFEQRMQEVIDAALSMDDIILFIDEMHLIWGAGRAEGVITDAANILKPVLSRGQLRVIGATTVEEFHRYIAKDAALARRFQEVRLNDPDEALTLQMIKSQAAGLEKHHRVILNEATLKQAINLSNRHLVNKHQPDKSVELLDSAAVYARKNKRSEILVTDLLHVLARQTGRPIAALTGEDRSTLRNLAANMKKRVVGQDEAIEKVTRTLIQRRQDLGDSSRNLGTFLFAGNSGVGKTELARTVAHTFFGDERFLKILDMSEYNVPESVQKLIGAPAGYMGSDKEGSLIGWLHEYQSGVILFDEIEKAHSEVHKLLLGMLDEGRIQSAAGERMDARQCVMILTTNAATGKDLSRLSVGFNNDKKHRSDGLYDTLSKHFPVEFLNRLDDMILFNDLDTKRMQGIIRIRLEEMQRQLEKKNVRLAYDEKRLIAHLLDQLNENKAGARGIARLIEAQILQAVSLALLYREDEATLHLKLSDTFYETGEMEVRG